MREREGSFDSADLDRLYEATARLTRGEAQQGPPIVNAEDLLDEVFGSQNWVALVDAWMDAKVVAVHRRVGST